jgi:tetratricopeptide (TPR) repeat protein
MLAPGAARGAGTDRSDGSQRSSGSNASTAARLRATQRLAEAVALQKRELASELRRSVSAGEDALTIWRAVGDKSREAATLHTLGRSRYLLSDLKSSVRDYQAALTIRVALNDQRGEAATRAYLATTYWALGLQAQALEEYENAVRLAARIADPATEAYAENGIGNLRYAQGDPTLAMTQYERALELWRTAGDVAGEGIALSNLGQLHAVLGERQLALERYRQALPRLQAARQQRRAADTLKNIGRVYDALGRPEQAVLYYTDALSVERASGNRRSEAQTRLMLADAYLQNRAPADAFREYTRAWQLARQIADRDTEANALYGRAGYHLSRRRYWHALRTVRRAFTLHHRLGDVRHEATDLQLSAVVLSAAGRHQDALPLFERAVALHRASGDRVGEGETRYEMARTLARTHEWTAARVQIEQAIAIVESLRTQLSSDGFRRSYFATVQSYYRWYIDLLMTMHREHPAEGWDRRALEASERGRARSLLDLLNTAGADVTTGVPPGLLQRQGSIRRALNFESDRRFQLPPESAAERGRLDVEIDRLVAEYDEVDAAIKRSSSQYADLAGATPLNVDQIQALLDADTTLVMYVAGEARIYAWVLTRSGASVRELTDPAHVRQLAASARDSLSRDPRSLLAIRAGGLSHATDSLRALSEAVLEPIASLLITPRIVIVASDALEYVPLGALPAPSSLPGVPSKAPAVATTGSSHSRAAAVPEHEPLAARREITYLPSASALERLRARVTRAASDPPAVAVFADPVFSSDDPRLGRSARRVSPAAATRGANVLAAFALDGALGTLALGPPYLPRLAATRQEAEIVARLAPADVLLALDFDANRWRVLNTPLERYRILHFATHAVIDDRHPELAGVLLSLLTPDGSPQDGFLRLHDIYGLRLSADLVVLSACQTAVGPEIRGEGMVGLVRGFMSAGAARVVASLWKVDDEATALLMREFYSGLLRDGLSASAALQRAQMQLWQNPRWNAPFYWAAFQLQGDWR